MFRSPKILNHNHLVSKLGPGAMDFFVNHFLTEKGVVDQLHWEILFKMLFTSNLIFWIKGL